MKKWSMNQGICISIGCRKPLPVNHGVFSVFGSNDYTYWPTDSIVRLASI